MSKIITQNDSDTKSAFESAVTFFKRFHVASALKAANAYKEKGVSAADIFQYLFAMAFTHQSMYMEMKSEKTEHI